MLPLVPVMVIVLVVDPGLVEPEIANPVLLPQPVSVVVIAATAKMARAVSCSMRRLLLLRVMKTSVIDASERHTI